MTSILDHKANFSSEDLVHPNLGTPKEKQFRERTSGRHDTKTFSDSSRPYSAVSSRRRNRFQNDYLGIAAGDGFAKERESGKEPLLHQYRKFEDDNVRFLATGKRLRRMIEKPRTFELNTERIQRLNVFPDGTPRTGFFADVNLEKSQDNPTANILNDLTTLFQKGIPVRIPGMNDASFQNAISEDLKSDGLKKFVFSEEQHRTKAEQEAKQRVDEIKQLLDQGNVSRQQIVNSLEQVAESGEITAEQLKELTKLTGRLANAKDDFEREQIIQEYENDIDTTLDQIYNKRKMNDLENIQKNLNPVFEKIAEQKIVGDVQAQYDEKTDQLLIEAPLTSDNALTWIQIFKNQTGPNSSLQFKDPNDVIKSIDNLEKGSWSKGAHGVIKNRERLALFGILHYIKSTSIMPSYQKVDLIERISKDIKYKNKNFSQKDRAQLFADFATDIDAAMARVKKAAHTKTSIIMTPPKLKKTISS